MIVCCIKCSTHSNIRSVDIEQSAAYEQWCTTYFLTKCKIQHPQNAAEKQKQTLLGCVPYQSSETTIVSALFRLLMGIALIYNFNSDIVI